MPHEPIPLADLNMLDEAAFTAAIGFVFEHTPWIARATWAKRPFASRADLHAALCATLRDADAAAHLALIRAHPDLAGRAAQQGSLGAASTSEQAAAGLDHLTPAEQAEFARLNAAYQAKFAFPFVICARENKKASILAGFRARLPNTPTQEIATALAEIEQIARLRLYDAVREP